MCALPEPGRIAEDSGRDAAADIAKGIGILFVIAGHCQFDFPDFMTYSFHMPLFFFISGFFIASFIENTSIPARVFLKRRCVRLLLPFFLYNLFFGFLGWGLQFVGLPITTGTLAEVMSFHNVFIEPFLSNHQFMLSCPLWFVPSLFCALLLVACLRPVLRYCRHNCLAAVFFMAALVLLYYLCVGCNEYLPYNWRFAARNVIGSIYVCLGYFYYSSRLARSNPKIILFIALLIYCALEYKYGRIHFSMFNNEYGTLTSRFASLPVALAGCMIIVALSRLIAAPQNFVNPRGFIIFGKNSFHVMAVHLSFFVALDMAICLCLGHALSEITTPYFRYRHLIFLYFIVGATGSYFYILQLAKIRRMPWKKIVSFWSTDPK